MIRRYIHFLIVVNILMILIGILTFRGPFHFWKDALSYLGATQNTSGEPNPVSPFFFDAGLLASGLICFRLAVVWKKFTAISGNGTRTLLFRIAGTGYFLMLAPCNLYNSVHSLGSTFVFGAFWVYSVMMIHEIGKKLGWRSFLFHLLLQGTILPYAYTYMILRVASKQFYQKFAVLGLMITLEIITITYLKKVSGQNRPHLENRKVTQT